MRVVSRNPALVHTSASMVWSMAADDVLLMSTVCVCAVLQVAQKAAAAEDQWWTAKGLAAVLQGQAKLGSEQAEVSARLKSIQEEMLKPPQENVHDMVMALVNRPELPQSTVGLADRVQEVSEKLRDMEGNILGISGMGGIGAFPWFGNIVCS